MLVSKQTSLEVLLLCASHVHNEDRFVVRLTVFGGLELAIWFFVQGVDEREKHCLSTSGLIEAAWYEPFVFDVAMPDTRVCREKKFGAPLNVPGLPSLDSSMPLLKN